MGKFLIYFRKFFQPFFKKKGFSLIELLTVVFIASTLSVVGIKTYRAQTNKARTAEAKHSLSYIWTAEESFRDIWNTYHENLVVVGAIPSGSYHYDVGFGQSVTISSNTDDNLKHYPVPEILNIKECLSFHEICAGDCLTKISTESSSSSNLYFSETYCVGACGTDSDCQAGCRSGANCKVGCANCRKNYNANTGDASSSSFSAYAIGKLKGDDVWSVDEHKTLTHVTDGTD